MIHPKTGLPLLPLYVDKCGRERFPILGASEDDGNDDPEDDGASGSGSGGSSGDGTGTEGQQQDGDNPSGKGEVTREEFERVIARMKAADRRADAAEQKVKSYEDKDKTELQKTADELKEVRGKLDNTLKENAELKLKVAFLSANDVQWHDPEDALRLADLSEVLDGEGNVDKKKLSKALQDLKSNKPHLVKQAKKDDEDEDEGETPPPSGDGTSGSGGKNKKTKSTDEDLKRKYRI